ncbi:glycerol-3-phosphate dehydrogenase [Salipiger mucosus]|uniref:Glycerol-3-phosphate dehydrogenase n=1 Tax=Salipiger mucosus DSM 16094 TaxID=1123237 RepID=S9RP43_9RHOB|nr:glycerol-3-phosphate dehydrogenase [Salipiger mucosus]EPX75774.1 Aerobic glycerol-3-phosphate dehydrogenase [Salipiger mucosus DSM 16094]
MSSSEVRDLFVIGGGVNGCGIARDAAGRGLSVTLAEMNDLAQATSSSSTKLFHGGLRYLEFFEFRLVHEALAEREVLLKAMPHISWPMRFVLPFSGDMRFESETPTSRLLSRVMPWMKGRRPWWLIRLGLFMYDHLGGRRILPGTKTVDLEHGAEGTPLQDRFERAWEYSDCWVEDSRLVVLNARDAQAHGAEILVRNKVVRTARKDDHWEIETEDETGKRHEYRAKMLVNAAGPWVGEVLQDRIDLPSKDSVRLVRGSHIVTRRIFDHDKAYFFQGTDGRIIFAIPYETDFTLIGTTEAKQVDPDMEPECTVEEQDYLLNFANQYFKRQLTRDDVVWTYSGVRPLYDDGARSATAATREYVLKLEDEGGAPLLNVFGGKITTYRRLAEAALEKIASQLPGTGKPWTAGAPLPGGDFAVGGFQALVDQLLEDYVFLDDRWARRLVRAYGTEARDLLGDATTEADLGRRFGADLTEREVTWLMEHEFARSAADVVWRRSKLGLRMRPEQVTALDDWMAAHRSEILPAAAE